MEIQHIWNHQLVKGWPLAESVPYLNWFTRFCTKTSISISIFLSLLGFRTMRPRAKAGRVDVTMVVTAVVTFSWSWEYAEPTGCWSCYVKCFMGLTNIYISTYMNFPSNTYMNFPSNLYAIHVGTVHESEQLTCQHLCTSIDGIKLPGGETFTVGKVGFQEMMVFTD